MDEIWVPTEWNKKIFDSYLKSVGFMDPMVHVIPEAVDVTLFDRRHAASPKEPWTGNAFCGNADIVPAQQPGGRRVFEFISIFKWERRKGWDILLDAYWSAFTSSDEVLLRLHTYVPSWVRGETNVTRIIQNYAFSKYGKTLNELAPVVWEKTRRHGSNSELSRADVRDLYGSADAFVLPTRGEGWGLPVAEAMAMELPVIVSDYSGPAVFANSNNAYMIPMTGEFDSLGFSTPSADALRGLLLQVIQDSCPSDDADSTPISNQKANLAREAISYWSPLKVAESMKYRIKVLASERGYFL
jgi:glycosyltransferase involved in cell wall biosynthesis